MRGGIPDIAKRFSKANNKYMQSYDDKKLNKYIIYLDANNLYDWAMIQSLLYGGFNWLNQKRIHKFDVNSIGKNSSIGYISEVDLEYLHKLHDLHIGKTWN